MKLPEIIARTSAAWPERTAIVHGSIRWTYEQLGNEASARRARLREAGFKPGDRAVLWMENSAEYLAAYLAILSEGGVVVPSHAKSLAG